MPAPTDALLRGLSGAELGSALRRERPDLKVLMVTGSPTDPVVTAFASAGGEVLQKPFRAATVVEAVRRTLA